MKLISSNTIILSLLAFLVYICFALGIIFLTRIIRKSKRVNYLVIVPIVVSFIFGLAIMSYAIIRH